MYPSSRGFIHTPTEKKSFAAPCFYQGERETKVEREKGKKREKMNER
jgi:hypothetical protein